MKKQLLSLLTLLTLFVANFTFAQNRSANVSSSGAHSLNNTSINPKASTQAVITTTTSTCMSINLPVPATWTQVNYGTGTPIFTDGFVNGPNIYGDKEKAMYFDASASANTMITQVYVGFDHAYSATPTKTVAIKFYDGTSGTPGASIGQGTLSMSTIMTDVTNNQYSLIIFGTPLTLPASKKFFASVDVTALSFTTATKDSLSIISNSDPQTTPTATWEKQSNNTWYKYDNTTFSWGLNISLLIHPFLTQAPIAASITVPTGTLCTGQSITYNSVGSTAGTYSWFFGAATTATSTGATASTSYTSSGTYTTQMVVQDACGSFGIATKTINVNTTPSPLLASNSPVCLGSPINLNCSSIAGASYQWSGPNAFSSGIQNPSIPSASVINSGVYTGSATVLGCTGTSSVMVNITTPTTSASNTGPFCVGTTINLNCPSATSYTWTGPNAFTSNLQNPTISNATLPMSGNYTLMVTTSSCTTTAVTMVTINTATTAASNSGPFCAGTTIQLNTPTATSYTWSGPSAFNSNVQNPTVISAALVNSGTYTVIITAANTCTAQATTSVTVNPLPTPLMMSNSPVCVGQAINFTSLSFTTYTWTGPSSFNTNMQNPTIPVSSMSNAGTYTLSVTDANGCINSASGTVTVSACTGINNVTENIAQFVVYPNPNNGDFTISLTGLDKTPSVEIYNTIGKLVYKDVLTTEKKTFNTNLAAGIYFINIIENNKVIAIQKLICK